MKTVVRFVKELLQGVMSPLRITASPLYRYPYRNSAEAFRGDWGRIGRDINLALERLDERR